ncbi:MAG: hypothetical protein JKY94_17510 [Rhodobacteraceae bacterium]|nr:hypothetical protein [Paracoccaceae bacterium]
MPGSAAMVYNINTASIVDNVATYIGELKAMASGDLPFLSLADAARVTSYFAAMQTELDYVNNFPSLDLSNRDPLAITLNPLPEQREFENQYLTFLDRLLRSYHTEASQAVSSRMASGIASPDYVRLNGIIAAANNYFSEYVEATNPVDSPETGGSTGADGSEGN